MNHHIENEVLHQTTNFVKALISSIMKVIQMTLKSVKLEKLSKKNTPFTSRGSKKIRLNEFLFNILTEGRVEVQTLISSLIYLKRYVGEKKSQVNSGNLTNLLLTCIYLSLQYNEDKIFPASFYAKFCGIKSTELIKFERLLLKNLDYKLYIDSSEYLKYEFYIVNDGLFNWMNYFNCSYTCIFSQKIPLNV